MTLGRILRNGKGKLVSYRAVILCLATFSFLLVVEPSPDVLHFAVHGLSVGSFANHLPKQYFDLLDCQCWIAPAAALAPPAPVTAPRLRVASASRVETIIDAWHSNRPPPIS